MYKIETFPIGIYRANCYLVWKDKHVIMIDPGGRSDRLKEYLIETGAIVEGILLTHGHFDHISGVDFFAAEFNCPVFIDEEDVYLLKDINANGSIGVNRETIIKSEITNYKVGKNKVSDFEFEVIFAPGHTHGCAMLRFDQHLFSGDVLFQGTIGRTDLIASDPNKMRDSLTMIKKLDPALIVYPGHGDPTTLKEELRSNPFLG